MMTRPRKLSRKRPDFGSRPDLPIAVIVGAGGMGMAIAQRLGQCHRVVLVSLQSKELERCQAQLHELGVVSTAVVCDITDPQSVATLGKAVAGLGSVQILVHVVGLSRSMGDWHTIMNVNLVGAARIEQLCQPLMAAGSASIFISSVAAYGPEPDLSLLAILDQPLVNDFFPRLEAAIVQVPDPGLGYRLSKLALNRMVQRQAKAWGERGARIVSLSPGMIDTEMGAIEDHQASRESKAALRVRLPLQRDGSMADIADAVEFLASRRASYITGTDLLVDGGLVATMRFPLC